MIGKKSSRARKLIKVGEIRLSKSGKSLVIEISTAMGPANGISFVDRVLDVIAGKLDGTNILSDRAS